MSVSVLELGGHAAAYCGRLFVQTGAEVSRIGQALPTGWASQSALDKFLNDGKQLLPEDADVNTIAQRFDVVVCEGRSADHLAQLGLDQLACRNRVAITPFGRTGPKRNWQSSSNVLLAMAGFTQLMGDADKAPLTLPGYFVEFQAGALAFVAAHAALRSPSGLTVSISQLEALLACSQFTIVRLVCAGDIRSRHGNDYWFVEPSNLYRCLDGWVYINIVPTFWEALTLFIDRPELILEPRFAGNDERMANREELHEIVGAHVARYSRDQLFERAKQVRIPLGPVLNFVEVLDDPHLRAREFFITASLQGQPVRVPGLPFRLDVAL